MAFAGCRQIEKGRKPSGNYLSIFVEIYPGKRSGSLHTLCGKGLYPRKQLFTKSTLYVRLGLGSPTAGCRYLAPGGVVRFFGRAHRRRAHKAGTLHRNGLPSNGSASRPTCRLRELHCLLHTHFAVRRCAICTKCVRRGNSSGIFLSC